MCLLCGFRGCLQRRAQEKSDFQVGVKMTGHAYDHYDSSKHIYSQNLETQEVWNFSKEDLVDRLL